MNTTVRARFFRASLAHENTQDFPDMLLQEMKKSLADREHDVADITQGDNAPTVLLRVEQCESEGEFVTGQFCRKQTTNIPPQAGPDGLTPIELSEGQGIGHVAAFRYHRPTRIFLLQNNIQCATVHRISVYMARINTASLFAFDPVMREDALERFKHRKVRSFTVRFASLENLEALDDSGIASARGARLLAEAFHGLDLTITVGVGRKRKKFLDFSRVNKEIKALLGSDADVSELEVLANEDEEGQTIDFIQEHLKCTADLTLPEKDPKKHYQVRKAFLKEEFESRKDYLVKHFGPKKKA
jgi:hypothetical protein